MRALILAAGMAKRLRPTTENVPKCLLEVKGGTILDRQLSSMMKHGIGATIVTGYRSDMIERHVKANLPEADIDFILNADYETTHAGYSLWLARHIIANGVAYLNGDLVFEDAMTERVLLGADQATTAVRLHSSGHDWDEEQVNVVIGDDGLIKKIGKHVSREESHGEFLGMTKVTGAFATLLVEELEALVEGGRTDFFAVDAIDRAIHRGGTMRAIDVSDLGAVEIDTAKDLDEGQAIPFAPIA
jgi:choline kinase